MSSAEGKRWKRATVREEISIILIQPRLLPPPIQPLRLVSVLKYEQVLPSDVATIPGSCWQKQARGSCANREASECVGPLALPLPSSPHNQPPTDRAC